jgi:probable rRNA maturation factor
MPEMNEEEQGVQFEYLETGELSFKNPKAAVRWILSCVERNNKLPGAITYVFTNDQELLKVNQQFLSHNDYTDIITFDYTTENTVSGDIFISVERVKENAKKFQESEDRELARVMIHGVLHLLGFKDKTPSDKKRMRKEEEKELNLCPYL